MFNKNKSSREKDYCRIPKSCQQAIPIQKVYEDGIFLTGRDTYSCSFRFTDINYKVASEADKESIMRDYHTLLNCFDPAGSTKLTLNLRQRGKRELCDHLMPVDVGDGLDLYRQDYNNLLLTSANGENSAIQDQYITCTIERKSIADARDYFGTTRGSLDTALKQLGSQLEEMNAKERMRVLHDFYRKGEENSFYFDIREYMRRGQDVRDGICPDGFRFYADYFEMGSRVGRVLFLKDYASFLADDFLQKLMGTNRDMMLSLDIKPVPLYKAIKDAEVRLLGVETNITNWQRKQNQNNNFSATVPYDLQQQQEEIKRFLHDLTVRNQKMMLVTLTLVLTADSKAELDRETESIRHIAVSTLSQLGVLRYQQYDGLNTVLPIGGNHLQTDRTLTTESLGMLMPFSAQEIRQKGGVYYGYNPINRNPVIIDRRKLLNGNGFVLATSGGGKTIEMMQEITYRILNTDSDVIIIDPEREYSELVTALGGEVIYISASSGNYINAMDLSYGYGEHGNPVAAKAQFLMSLCEQTKNIPLSSHEKSLIDRCTTQVYRDYEKKGFRGEPPTLQDFYEVLKKQPEPEAVSLALDLELFIKGSLSIFAHQTNVDTNSRLICFDIHELGEQLLPVGYLVILDSILNRITRNRGKKSTFVYIDEIYLLFEHEYSEIFLQHLWKRIRKYDGYATGITQNVEDLLQSHKARTMLSNSEFLIMLNQAPQDQETLQDLLNISRQQARYIQNVSAGEGLIKVKKNLIPFKNQIPKDSVLLKLMTANVKKRQDNW